MDLRMLQPQCLCSSRKALASFRSPQPRGIPEKLTRRISMRSYEQNDSGFFSAGFSSALKDALSRGSDADREAVGNGFGSGPSYQRGEASHVGKPVIQVLATALANSRQTLDRLHAEKVELEAIIEREAKQVERFEWLLSKIQQDYSYFNTLQRMYDEREQQRGSDNQGGYY